MSTISSNADINTKYQRIAAEYAKLKSQIPILKNAVISEQAKTEKLTDELHKSESAVRRLEGENEGLEFRNGQLLRRVECLQNEVDLAAQQHHSKKKGGSARNSPRTELPKNNNSLLEGELLAKVRENEELHSKVFELESTHEKEISALVAKCTQLEDDNKALRAELNLWKPSQKSQSEVSGGEQCAVVAATTVPDSVAGSSDAASEGTHRALVVDATRRASTVFASFASLLQLFEQRSTIYPNDMHMEKLPEATLRYGRSLLRSSELFEASGNQLESVATRASEDDRADVIGDCFAVVESLGAVAESTKEWRELFEEGVACENRLSWSGPTLCRSNDEWKAAFGAFVQLLSEMRLRVAAADTPSLEEFRDLVERLSLLSSECSRTFTKKLFDENRVPTASRRLRCVNECIEKCLVSISRNLANLVALLSLVASSLHASRALPPEAISTSECLPAKREASVNEDFHEVKVVDVQETSTEISVVHETVMSAEDGQTSASETPDTLCSELNSTRSRVIELEKERERFLVEIELLKMKLNGGLSEVPSSGGHLLENNELLEFVSNYFEQRIGELIADNYYARSRATYFQNECEDLLRCSKLAMEDRDSACEKLDGANRSIAALRDDLETTQKGYEEQMRSLYEHMGELNTKIESQSETINSLTSPANGITPAKQGSRRMRFK